MVRRTIPDVRGVAVAVPADLDKLMDTLAGTDEWTASGPAHQGEHLYTSERVIVSPTPGVFEPDVQLAALESTALAEATAAPGSGQGAEPGSVLAVGDRVGTVGLTDVRTPFDGILVRWLAVRGERVVEGQPVAWIRTPGSTVVTDGADGRGSGGAGHRRDPGHRPGLRPVVPRPRRPGGGDLAVRGGRTPVRGSTAPGGSCPLACDVTDPDQVKAAFDAIEETWGPVEVLVANAGITRDTLVLRMSEEAWSEVIDTNLSGVFRVTKRALAKMIRLHRGRVIMVSSVGAFIGSPGQANYAASKAGLVGMARSMAREVASRSITVNVVAPGLVETNMLAALGEERMTRIPIPGAAGSGGPARGDRRGHRVSGLGRGRLHHRCRPARRRRPGYGPVSGVRPVSPVSSSVQSQQQCQTKQSSETLTKEQVRE